jgi:glycosyltransferase involved in cell wall biosynthesis
MRILLDLQGAQTDSRIRGIGRYSLALAKGIVKNCSDHEVFIVLNGLFPNTIQEIRVEFDGLLPQSNIVVWHAPTPLGFTDSKNTWRRHSAELIREAFLASLRPDIVHISSLIEGVQDDATHSIGALPSSYITAVTLYDLIPLIQSDVYLKPNPVFEKFYLEKLEYLKKANLYLSISDSSRQEIIQHLKVAEEDVVNISAAVTGNFQPIAISANQEQTIRLRFGLKKPFIMYSGATDERKNHLRLIKAFSILPQSLRSEFQLAIVGHLPKSHREKFEAYAKICGLKENEIIITGRIDDSDMVKLCNLAKLFVFPSWHEGFGLPALEAMSCGTAVIASNTSSLPEVIGRDDAMFDPYDANAISQKIQELLNNEDFRIELAQYGLRQAEKFSWDASAKKAIAAFEEALEKQKKGAQEEKKKLVTLPLLIENIARLATPSKDENDWLATAKAIAQNHSPFKAKQLFIDISELVHRDSRTGVQRVVRSVLTEILSNPPTGYIVEPVYAMSDEYGYRYARNFHLDNDNLISAKKEDDFVEAFNGDIFFGLDLQHHIVLQQASYYDYLQNIGVSTYFVVYDLLPISLPSLFMDHIFPIHVKWLQQLAKADGLMCISKSVADELSEWLPVSGVNRLRPLKLGWFHLGADVDSSVPSKGLPSDAAHTLKKIASRPTFLMVGTIEPRKGQMQTLLAFEQLWHQGVDINLVIIGKSGWNVDLLLDIIRSHTELGSRLFWLDGISDEYLMKVYSSSTCLIAASEGEGFGLPLIEAAQYKLPILARDLPIFREVAGSNAYFFENSKSPNVLAQSIRDWQLLFNNNMHPDSTRMHWLTWKLGTQQILDTILEEKWYKQWMSDDVLRFTASDERFGTQIGVRTGNDIYSSGKEGFLIFGPYITLDAGSYRVNLRGVLVDGENNKARFDVATDRGETIINQASINTSKVGPLISHLTFKLLRQQSDIEVRVFVEKGCILKLARVEIEHYDNSDVVAEALHTKDTSSEKNELNLDTLKVSSKGLLVESPLVASTQSNISVKIFNELPPPVTPQLIVKVTQFKKKGRSHKKRRG